MTFDIVALDEVLVACEPFLRKALGDQNTLILSVEPDLWQCRIDPQQFEAAVLNLAVNARDAMPSGGQMEIGASNTTIDVAETNRAGELAAGEYVVVQVIDTGSGMDPDVAARAFEPFFTTKEVGKGTGLGLSQVYGFIKQSGGHITLHSRPGVGTTFRLYLPRCTEMEAVREPQGQAAQAPPTGHETVLVVEDNADVLDLAVTTIRDLGYRVLTAPNGPLALDIVKGGEPIDLLFSDVVMPGGMTGFELVSKARTVRRDLKALVTSGYANVQRPGTDRPDVPLLLKPYRRGDLARSIRMALDLG